MRHIYFICILLLPNIAASQNIAMRSLMQTVEDANTASRQRFFAEKQDRLVLKLLVVPLRLYKSVLSEQLAADCQFEPTCSVYGYQSLHVYGPLLGIMSTADRLLRCNGNAGTAGRSLSHFNPNGKIIDYPSRPGATACPFTGR